jgi:hypothetical protein
MLHKEIICCILESNVVKLFNSNCFLTLTNQKSAYGRYTCQ